jgi:thioredoxin-like negative regulator of GroEL
MMARDSLKSGSDHGEYNELNNEKEILQITTNTKRVVCHFFHKDFRRCDIMDKHLKTLATNHIHTRFVKINVENAPFLIEKLAVRVLPCVIAFIDGHALDR